MLQRSFNFRFLMLVLSLLGTGLLLRAGTATNITGLYYTGNKATGGLQGGGQQDGFWDVTYVSFGGVQDTSGTYTGSAYVVDPLDAGWVDNTSGAQWIVAPGARDTATGTSVNTGGSYLPGNGTSNANGNTGRYIYTLAFTITGTGSGTVTNAVSISLTIAADDRFAIYVNPTGNGTSDPTGSATAAFTQTVSSWTNTTAAVLSNGTTGYNGNSRFKIGTNYIVVVVDNTDSQTTGDYSTNWNPSGLMMYQVGSAVTINGNPIPEMATWMPVSGALGLYGLFAFVRIRRRKKTAA